MILFYLNNQNNESQSRIIRTLFKSFQGEKELSYTYRFPTNAALNEKARLIVFAGFIRGEGLIYNYCKKYNKNFLYVDHAYIDRGYNPFRPNEEWMRITCNDFNWNKNLIEPNDRWNLYFSKKHPLSPWNSNSNKSQILLLPPSKATQALFPDSIKWTEKTLEEIKKRTDVPIKIREKPLQPVVNPETNQVIDFLNFKHVKTIDKEILDSKLIVSYNSAVSVTATIKGIPCYSSENSAAYPMNINLDYINNPPEPIRQPWLNQLVYHQYNSAEMKSGKVWKLLESYIPR